MKSLSLSALKVVLFLGALWLPLAAHAANNILVLGDSLSAGYGIAAEKSWPRLLQEKLKHSHPGFDVINASISGETTLGGRERIAGALKQHRPAVVIIALGANDGLRGYRAADMEANLDEIIRQAKRARAKVLLVGMKLPPNYGKPYVTEFENVFARLARKHRIALLPFLLEGVPPEQFQADNLHPTADTQSRIMQNVLQKLAPMLK